MDQRLCKEQAERHRKAGGKCFIGFVSDEDFNRACQLASKELSKRLSEELKVSEIDL